MCEARDHGGIFEITEANDPQTTSFSHTLPMDDLMERRNKESGYRRKETYGATLCLGWKNVCLHDVSCTDVDALKQHQRECEFIWSSTRPIPTTRAHISISRYISSRRPHQTRCDMRDEEKKHNEWSKQYLYFTHLYVQLHWNSCIHYPLWCCRDVQEGELKTNTLCCNAILNNFIIVFCGIFLWRNLQGFIVLLILSCI